MEFEKEILNSVRKQLEYNKNKNLFMLDFQDNFFVLSEDTKNFLKNHRKEIIDYYENIANLSRDSALFDKIIDTVLDEFYQSNQFLQFKDFDIAELRELYLLFLSEMLDTLKNKSSKPIDMIINRHYKNLQNWLDRTNPFVKIVNILKPYVIDVVCAEYSSKLQLAILEIDLKTLKEPVIDIGCGKRSIFVNFLRQKGIKAFGIDRTIGTKNEYLRQEDWIKYVFKPSSWGSIISHMSYSNHFIHQHFHKNGQYLDYAKKYVEILKSLVKGGSFYYAPGLPFIEQYLDQNEYKVHTRRIVQPVQRHDITSSTIITRLS
jgi:hypothetical protein